MTITTNHYALRDVTNKKRQLSRSKPTQNGSRKVLKLSESASLVRKEEHDCSTLNVDHILNKVTQRLLHTMSRFSLSYALECETIRGKTRWNGDSCTCGGCQAAHAALSSVLYDNILDLVRENLLEKRFNQLDPIQQKYLIKRFRISEEEKEKLSAKQQHVRLEAFATIISRLTPEEKKGSYVNTALEKAKAATFANPRSSNRFDAHLEHHLRPLEDKLAEECRTKTKNLIEAMIAFQNAYRALLETAVHNLKNDLINLNDLSVAWKALIFCQSQGGDFGIYLSAVDNYVKAYEKRFTKQQGAPSLKEFQEYLKRHQSPHILKKLQQNRSHTFFQENVKFLKNPAGVEKEFAEAREEIHRRLIEAEHQLKVVIQTPDEIKGMLKYLYGSGDLKTPTKTKIAEELIDLLPTLTPTRSDLKKRPRTDENLPRNS